MSKANQAARKEGTELDLAECRMIQQRSQLCQLKSSDLQRAQMELQMLNEAAQRYITELMVKYELDMTRQYQFNGKALIEVIPPEVEPPGEPK